MREGKVAGGQTYRDAGGSLKRGKPRARKAKAVLERTPVQGWKTSDMDEIILRRWRGRTEILDVAPQQGGDGFFGLYRARSASAGAYEVEITKSRPNQSIPADASITGSMASAPASISKASSRRFSVAGRARFAPRRPLEARGSRCFSIGAPGRPRRSHGPGGRTRRHCRRLASGWSPGSKTTVRCRRRPTK